MKTEIGKDPCLVVPFSKFHQMRTLTLRLNKRYDCIFFHQCTGITVWAEVDLATLTHLLDLIKLIVEYEHVVKEIVAIIATHYENLGFI